MVKENKKYREKETDKVWYLIACFRGSWDNERTVYLKDDRYTIIKRRTELYKEFQKIINNKD